MHTHFLSSFEILYFYTYKHTKIHMYDMGGDGGFWRGLVVSEMDLV